MFYRVEMDIIEVRLQMRKVMGFASLYPSYTLYLR